MQYNKIKEANYGLYLQRLWAQIQFCVKRKLFKNKIWTA